MTESRCYHCNLPVPPGSCYSVVIQGQSRPLCCPGCQAVAAAIVNGGLERFYHYRSVAAVRPEEDRDLSLEVYDLPDVQADFVSVLDTDLLSADLAIAGMTCSACAWLIEEHLARTSGVESVRVNAASHRCKISWHPGRVKFSHLLSAFVAIGYEARPAGDSAAEAARQRENRRYLLRLGVAGIAMMQVGMVAIALYAGAFSGIESQWQSLLRWASLLMATPVVFYSARPFFVAATRALCRGYLVMDVPVSIAILLAYGASLWATLTGSGDVYFDSVTMFTFFLLLGRFLEMRVRHRNAHLVAGFARLIPDAATRLVAGVEQTVPVKALAAGDLVRVDSGATIPCDGEVVSGRSSVIESVMTGEQTPVTKGPGSAVSAGTVNAENPLQICVRATGRRTRLAAIMDLVDQAQAEKPRQAAVADRIAGWFVGAVLVVALLVAGYWWWHDPHRVIWITLSVLVVTCPCALSLATPAALTVATGELRRKGFLIHRAHVLETLARVDCCVLDKTGTLTLGDMRIQQVIATAGDDNATLLALATSLERGSRHPIARAFAREPDAGIAMNLDHRVGEGISGVIAGKLYAIGKPAFVADALQLATAPYPNTGAGVWLALASKDSWLGWIGLDDQLRSGARNAVERLEDLDVSVQLLSGDRNEAVARMAGRLGIDQWLAEVSPRDKLERIRELQSAGRVIMMVGDGINDIPVLSGADISVAMADATDFTRLHADSLLISGNLSSLAGALVMARRTAAVIRQNLWWALAYNSLALPLAAAGMVPPWAAAIGMSASSLLVVVNALQLSLYRSVDTSPVSRQAEA